MKRTAAGTSTKVRRRDATNRRFSIDTPIHTFDGQFNCGGELGQTLVALREDLEGVPIARVPSLRRHSAMKSTGIALVEEVAHRVDEDHPRSRPTQRLVEPLGQSLRSKPCS